VTVAGPLDAMVPTPWNDLRRSSGVRSATLRPVQFDVTVEIPKGQRNKYELDHATGRIRLDRMLFTSTRYPADYGYIPGTFNPSDNDELDVLVLSRDPLAIGSAITVRVIGLLRRPDGDDKILGVLVGDPEYGDTTSLNDVPVEIIRDIEAWFREWSEVGEWDDPRAAEERIHNARELAAKWKRSPRE
jgi:inorganic pyrophosphatase